MLNREQRRAQLKKLSQKVNGIDVSRGVVEIPVKGCDEPLTVDIMNFDTIFHLSEMCNNFTDMRTTYADMYAPIKALEDEQHQKIQELKDKLMFAKTDADEEQINNERKYVMRQYNSKVTMLMLRLYKKAISDFTEHVDAVFGDGATVKVFGNSTPMPQAIAEFIEDIGPIATILSSLIERETEPDVEKD